MAEFDNPTRFIDRADAGARLASRLRQLKWSDPVVLGLARGGVPIALRVAEALDAPLDVAVARKIGAPRHPELGVGAVTADGPAHYDRRILASLGLTAEDLREDCERERAEARRRMQHYRRHHDPPPLHGRDVLLVDDGLATGVTARAALRQLRAAEPGRLVFAAPVGARESRDALGEDADEVVCLSAPARFGAVGLWYVKFPQLTDDDVLAALAARTAV